MPDIVGLTEDAAYQAVKSAQSSVLPQGYYAYTTQKSCNGSTDPALFGRVFAQTPAPGSPLAFRVPATASIYQSCTIVPDVVGLAHSAASNAIYGAGLQVAVNGRVPCQPGVDGSVVTNQDTAPGTIVPTAAIINLVETAVNCP
jgi:beta-lactam-binding protein with PASTA domain